MCIFGLRFPAASIAAICSYGIGLKLAGMKTRNDASSLRKLRTRTIVAKRFRGRISELQVMRTQLRIPNKKLELRIKKWSPNWPRDYDR